MISDKFTVLLSAYACFGNFGSEPGVGIRWLYALLDEGAKVDLATSGWSYEQLKKNNPDVLGHDNLNLIVIGSKDNDKRFRRNRAVYQLYILIWQIRLYLYLRRGRSRYDYVQHLTFGGVLVPSLIASFGRKSIYGPVGGAEKAPFHLAMHSGWKGMLKESFKRGALRLCKIDPFLFYTKKSFDKVLLKNKDNLSFYSSQSKKCFVKSELALDVPVELSSPDQTSKKIIFSGRGLYWKGGEIAILAVKHIHEVLGRKELVLEFFGEGPEYSRWKRVAIGCDYISFKGRLNQSEYLSEVGSAGCVIFPSYHDSSGNVVLEALAKGIPVVAFDLGGPSSIVSHNKFLVNPNLKRNDLISEIASKIITAIDLTSSQRIEISDFYKNMFSRENLLKGVYQ